MSSFHGSDVLTQSVHDALTAKILPNPDVEGSSPKRTTEQLARGTYVKSMVLFYPRLCATPLELNISTITLPGPPNLSTNFLAPFPMEGSHGLRFRYDKSNLIFWASLLCHSQATLNLSVCLFVMDRRHTWLLPSARHFIPL